MTALDWRAVFAHVADACRSGGLDLAHPLSLAWLPETTVPHALRTDALGVLVGNTRALWPALRERLADEGELPAQPVDAHVETILRQAVEAVDAPVLVFYAHRRYEGSYLPFQRMAHDAGWLHLSPSHLSLHPQHGPWVALRALVVFDVAGPPPPAPVAPDPCTPCDKPCLAALERAAALDGSDPQSWRAWLEVRDACPEGRASRYGEAQIRYHYTKDREHLPDSTSLPDST
jgi:methylmalonic aciduria homocystinuria type C protein